MSASPSVSVLVVAVADGPSLRRCLGVLRRQADALAAELVLVVNAAEGSLPRASAEALAKLCDVLAYEPTVGKSNALNTGVALCRGDVIAFTDDDAVPQDGWLEAITRPLVDPGRPARLVGCGGPVTPVYPAGDPPAWYRRLVDDRERHFLGPAHDLGEAAREYPRPGGEPTTAPLGASCAYRREVFARHRYDPELGPNRETGGRGGEDFELGFRLLLEGQRIAYLPSARVEHPVIAERLTWRIVRHHTRVNGAEWIRALRKVGLPLPAPEHVRRRLSRRRRRLPFRWITDPAGHRRRQAKIVAARGMLEELEREGPPGRSPERAPPHVLFVPGGGRSGLGETVRSLVLAHAVRDRWPAARVGFLTDEAHARLPGDDLERHTVGARVSRSTAEVNRLLRGLAPDLVVFDGRGQGAQIACAARAGARTLYIAAVPAVRRRVFRWSRLRRLDQVWLRRDIVDPGGGLTVSERLRLLLAARPRVHFVPTVFPEPRAARLAELRRRLGLGDEPYLLFAPGGGGWRHEGRPVSDLFVEAAGRVHEASRRACVVVAGPLHEQPATTRPGVIGVPSLSPEEMVDLVAGAELVVCGGGDLLGHALATGRACVATPAGGADQPERIGRCERAGLVVAAPLSAAALAASALALLDDGDRRAGLQRTIAEAGLHNGLPRALALIEELLGGAAPEATRPSAAGGEAR